MLRTTDDVLTVVDVFVNARYGYDVPYEVVGETGTVSLAPSHAGTRSPLASARDGLRAIEVAEALIESMNNAGAVTPVRNS
ncbi:hypothetical protein [Rhodococcus sp. NPDC057529]|uniref:hypothetical protein n=1 Tax=Rhodococcus sp. NPDC057529 TaxID=3346158 RepID=UPI00366E81D8